MGLREGLTLAKPSESDAHHRAEVLDERSQNAKRPEDLDIPLAGAALFRIEARVARYAKNTSRFNWPKWLCHGGCWQPSWTAPSDWRSHRRDSLSIAVKGIGSQKIHAPGAPME